jgi:hypothetical protein
MLMSLFWTFDCFPEGDYFHPSQDLLGTGNRQTTSFNDFSIEAGILLLVQVTPIHNMLQELQSFPIKSRTDTVAFKKEAELVLLLKERSHLAVKRSQDKHFMNNVM